jgi:hypothetical protein
LLQEELIMMDRTQLDKWKEELESELAIVEKQLAEMEKKRAVLKTKLGAVGTLLSPMENVTVPPDYDGKDPVGEFIVDLKTKGWSFEREGGKTNIYIANRGGNSVGLWIKFSKLSEVTGNYWFGVNPDLLKNKDGGVILLLGTHQQYVCISFTKLHELLEGSKNTKTGQKFQIRQKGGRVELQPAGFGGKWIDVTSYLNGEGLKKIGIN